MPPWGVIPVEAGTLAPEQGFLITKDCAKWLASFMAESCNCGPHSDHIDCIAEYEAIIYTLKSD